MTTRVARYAYGYRNAAFYNTRPEGDLIVFSSRKDRDKALARLRETAIEKGLSESAAYSGIWSVRLTASRVDMDDLLYREERGEDGLRMDWDQDGELVRCGP